MAFISYLGLPSPTADFLFLVVDSGLYLDEQGDKDAKLVDFQTFVNTLQTITHIHFCAANNRIAIRRVPCPDFSSCTIKVLRGLEPQSSGTGGPVLSHYCMAVLPLLVAEGTEYLTALSTLVSAANGVYQEFINSDEGKDFAGKVGEGRRCGQVMGVAVGVVKQWAWLRKKCWTEG